MTGYEGRAAAGLSAKEQHELDRDSLAMLPCPNHRKCGTDHFQYTHQPPQHCDECTELMAANGGVMP